MMLPENKIELLQKLATAFSKLDSEFDDISPTFERQLGICGELSCCDIVAYQIGWGRLLLTWDACEAAGRVPAMPAENYKWNQLGELAQSFYVQSEHISLLQLRSDWALIVEQIFDWIEVQSNSDLFSPQQREWTGEKWPMVKWIQVNTIAPYQSARTKVRCWKRDTIFSIS